jgi:hypothetical protein
MDKQYQGGTAPLVNDLGGGAHVPYVSIFSGTDSSAATQLKDYFYKATAVTAEMAIDDIVRKREVVDGLTGETLSAVWLNITQGTTLAEAPPADTIVLNSNDPVVDKLEEIRLLLAGRTFEAWLNLAVDVEDNSTAIFDVGFPGLLASAVPVIGFAHQLPTGVDLVGAVVNDEFVTVTVTNNSGASLPSGTPVLVRARI